MRHPPENPKVKIPEMQILVCGCPRSGTTSLVELLNNNGITITNEWGSFGYTSGEFSSVATYLTDKRTVVTDHGMTDWFYKHSGLHFDLPPNLDTLTYADIVSHMYQGRVFYGDKWKYELLIKQALAHFPLAKCIYIYRNPLGAVASMVKAKIASSMGEAFSIWEESISAWLSWKDSVSHLAIRQEDLALNPVDVSEKISRYLGVRVNPVLPFDSSSETLDGYQKRIIANPLFYEYASDADIPENVLFLAKRLGYFRGLA